MKLSSSSLLVALALVLSACSGPPIPTPLTGEPVCEDFEIGATKARLEGGLKNPVLLTVKEGESTLFKSTLLGLRTPKSTPTRVLLPDDDGEYTVEWAQCANTRAPRSSEASRDTKHATKTTTAYECGEAKVYKTETLKTKKGDRATHALTFPAPPNPQCWTSETPTGR